MASYPIEIRRCRHVKTNGTQCGSPALKDKELCYYHEQNRPEPVEFYIGNEPGCAGQMVLPVFEDAHSIQTVIRQVVQLLLAQKIDRKDAGLMLYALQIASSNLKTMQAEKARPTQMVVEPEKAAETPLGMTPWSATGRGHDLDEGGLEAGISMDRPASVEECYAAMTCEEKQAMRKGFEEMGVIRSDDVQNHLCGRGPDPLLPEMKNLREVWELRARA